VINVRKGIKDAIKKRYAGAALTVKQSGGRASCCSGSSCCSNPSGIDLTGGSYTPDELAHLPADAWLASLGCGNPTALAEISEGDVVLDLGSGGGIDVLLSAKRVGPSGKAYGLDMTDEMLSLARQNQQKSGITNAEFLKGDIEQIPLPDNHVDVVISNCVINLAVDKDKALREAFRVLKPGGRFAVSDIVFLGDKSLVPEHLMKEVEQWASCLSGALAEEEYRSKLKGAGFTDISIQVTQVYDETSLKQWAGVSSWPKDGVQVVSAFVRARKSGS
jgi:arsenite methyltransferase